MKRKPPRKSIVNRRAKHDYDLENSFVVGISLTGAETKALRQGLGHLQGAYITIKGGELWLVNGTISGNAGLPISEQDQTRTRKLLAKRKEIEQLDVARQQGRTIVPLELLTNGRYVKLRIAAGRGKKRYDKRQTLKKRDEERRMAAALKPR